MTLIGGVVCQKRDGREFLGVVKEATTGDRAFRKTNDGLSDRKQTGLAIPLCTEH